MTPGMIAAIKRSNLPTASFVAAGDPVECWDVQKYVYYVL